MTTTGFALHLAGVRKTFRPGNAAPITAVDNASLDLAAGDTAALTGLGTSRIHSPRFRFTP